MFFFIFGGSQEEPFLCNNYSRDGKDGGLLQFGSLGSLSQTSCMCFSLTVKITRTLVLQVEILESRTKCITEYKVSLCPVAEAPAMAEAAEDCLVETLGSDETTAFFPNLSPNTEYKLEVLGLDHDNQFSYSSGPLMVRTAPGELVLSKIALGKPRSQQERAR
jgi:hypothetical protein